MPPNSMPPRHAEARYAAHRDADPQATYRLADGKGLYLEVMPNENEVPIRRQREARRLRRLSRGDTG